MQCGACWLYIYIAKKENKTKPKGIRHLQKMNQIKMQIGNSVLLSTYFYIQTLEIIGGTKPIEIFIIDYEKIL